MQHIHQNILCYRPRKNIREKNKFTTFVSFLQFIYFWGNKFPVAAFSILSPIQWSGQHEPSRNMGDRCLLSVDIKPQLTDKNIFPLFLLAVSFYLPSHDDTFPVWWHLTQWSKCWILPEDNWAHCQHYLEWYNLKSYKFYIDVLVQKVLGEFLS